jgi:hypothetical protein
MERQIEHPSVTYGTDSGIVGMTESNADILIIGFRKTA